MYLPFLFVVSLAIASEAAVKGGRYVPADSQQRPFYGTKGRVPEEAGVAPTVLQPPTPNAEPGGAEINGPPMPYAFSYTAEGHDGRSARQESSDGQKVTGSYMLEGPDGINRIVHYVADENGFRATVMTNEPGTESQNPAEVIMNSSQPPAEEIALKYGAGPQAAPQQYQQPANYVGASNNEAPAFDGFDQDAAPLSQQLRDDSQQIQDEPQQYAQPQILSPPQQAPSKQRFGFRQTAPLRAPSGTKGYNPPPQPVKKPQPPPQPVKRPQPPPQPVKRPQPPPQAVKRPQYAPRPLPDYPQAPPPPPPRQPQRTRPLPEYEPTKVRVQAPARTKFNAAPKPQKFFNPKPTQPPQQYFEEQQQQKEELFDEPQVQQKEEQQPQQQQQKEELFDEPQQQQQANFFRS